MESFKAGAIKNPLTIIAIFAGIAEISGTLVLPHISPENQHLYIWFLMTFPSVLVIIFFATLNFNHRVLYAPSDFNDEGHFVNLIRKASPIEVLGKVVEDEVAAIDVKNETAEKVDSEHSTAAGPQDDNTPLHDKETTKPSSPVAGAATDKSLPSSTEHPAEKPPEESLKMPRNSEAPVARAKRTGYSTRSLEKFSILETSREFFAADPQFDVKLGDSSYVFDAITETGTNLTIWESFTVTSHAAAKEKARRFLSEALLVSHNTTEKLQTKISVVIMPIYGSTVAQEVIDDRNKDIQVMLSSFGMNGIVLAKRMDEVWEAANRYGVPKRAVARP
ncbi:hypothetical protein [Herbaspirillum sp. NPDC101396]|uniref:hypothetical protein n=1 Tax=Herbaspirillum sp. NPDC101396 TaxID=3364005 RepID=UPI00383A4F83